MSSVASYDGARRRRGKVHRSQRKATASRNRSSYRVACGVTIRYGLPIPDDEVFRTADMCGHCFPGSTLGLPAIFSGSD